MSSGEILQQQLLATARAMNSQGLNQGTSGNVSVRANTGTAFFITPSALPYERCQPEDMVRVDDDGSFAGRLRPSSEWQLHAALYKRFNEAGAVLHAHAPWCTVLACLQRSIPAFHYMVAVAGGSSIPCTDYAPFGSSALAELTVKALDGRRACLLAHHGMVCYAADLEAVFALAMEVENLARTYCRILQVGEPQLLDDREMADILARFAAYRP
ncbi:MAG: class II aldolase [Desulfobulbus propionicus]|nr:MAG: class II aldolase [Desulfobulbus propionicus]